MAKKVKKTATLKVKEKKQHTLDIFNVLGRLDKREMNLYFTLSEEEKKAFTPLIIMRWMSCVNNSPDIAEYYIKMINECVNKHFWTISKHPELLCKLLAICGIGDVTNHYWLKVDTKKSSSKREFFQKYFGEDLKEDEAQLMLQQLNDVDVISLLENSGFQNDQIEKIVQELEKIQ